MMRKPLLAMCVFIFIVLSSAFYIYRSSWLPVYNEFFSKHNYSYPKVGSNFVVGLEPKISNWHPFLFEMIIKAFPEYNVIFDNEVAKPDLIVLSEGIKSRDTSYKGDVPYITYSGEPKNLHRRRYRTQGLPFAQIVVFKPVKDNQIYVPFFLWSGVKLNVNREGNVNADKKFLVYVSENCVKQRDSFFAFAKKYNSDADALGKCSNTVNGELVPGGYTDLNSTYSQYNFVMAMENMQKPGYVSEKIFNAFNSGAIPIYWGDSETVEKIFNKNAYIDVSKYSSIEEAAKYISELQKDSIKIAKMKQEPVLATNPAYPWSLEVAGDNYLVEHAKKLRALYDAKVK